VSLRFPFESWNKYLPSLVYTPLSRFHFLKRATRVWRSKSASSLFSSGPVHLRTLQLGIRLAATTHESSRQKFVCERMGTCSRRKSSFGRIQPMHLATKYWKFLAAFALSLFLLPSVTTAQHYKPKELGLRYFSAKQCGRDCSPRRSQPQESLGTHSFLHHADPSRKSLVDRQQQFRHLKPLQWHASPINIFTEPAVSPETLSSFRLPVLPLRERNLLPPALYFNAVPPIFCWIRGHPRADQLCSSSPRRRHHFRLESTGHFRRGGSPPSTNAVLEVDKFR